MSLKDLFIKIDAGNLSEEEFIAGLKPLTADEKNVAIKCYAFKSSDGQLVSFFASFSKKYPDLMKELINGCSRTEEGNLARAKIYEDLIKEVKGNK